MRPRVMASQRPARAPVVSAAAPVYVPLDVFEAMSGPSIEAKGTCDNPAEVRIRLRYFASIREALGRREESLDVPAGSTVEAVWEQLVARVPALRVQRYRPAVNQEYVTPATVLAEDDELVFIPPVSGGSPTER